MVGEKCHFADLLMVLAMVEVPEVIYLWDPGGTDVRDMQRKLIALGYSCGSAGADGVFGQGTYDAVCRFQRTYGLSVDGIIGPATRAKINSLYSRL